MSQAQLEKKVSDYLRKSQALEDYWQRPITADQLQAEMDRMAKHTRQPEVLGELFDALGNDPFVIAECLARPALAERLLKSWYAYDQRIHGELKQRAEAELLAHPPVDQMRQLSGNYSEIEFVKFDGPQDEANHCMKNGVKLNAREWAETLQQLSTILGDGSVAAGVPPAKNTVTTEVQPGVLSSLQEDEANYYTTTVTEKSKDRIKVATVAWQKMPLESWLTKAESQTPTTIALPATNYMLPNISDGTGCIDDTWTPTPGPPDPRYRHTAVWTGNEMIVWGGYNFNLGDLNTGGRYNPSCR